MSVFPQVPVLIPANVLGNAVQYAGPAGAMGGGSAFTVLLLAKMAESLADVSQEIVLAQNTDGATKGWKITRPANTDVLAVTVYNASGGVSARSTSLRGRGGMLACVMAAMTGPNLSLYVNGTLLQTVSTADGLPITPGDGQMLLGDATNPLAWNIAAFAYKGVDRSLVPLDVDALVDSALAFALAIPVGVGTSFNGNSPAGNPFWDYAYDAKDLIDPTAPGGVANSVNASIVTVTPPLALAAWPSAYAQTANQPGQAAAPTAGVSLAAVAPRTGAAQGLLGQASLHFMQLKAASTPDVIFGSKLASWLRADDNLAGGANWPNRVAGQSAFARQGGAPTLVAIGGAPALHFAGTNGYKAAPLAAPIPAGQRASLITVFRPTAAPGAGTVPLIGILTTTPTEDFVRTSLFGATATLYSQVNTGVAGADGGFIFSPDATVGTAYAIGTQFSETQTRTVPPGALVPAEGWLGGDTTPDNPLNAAALAEPSLDPGAVHLVGDVAEQIILSSLPTPTELQQLYSYFTARYGSLGP